MSEEANNALSELKNELKGAINVRLRSPVAGLFALSWLLVNHRVMFVLFSDMKVGKKFDYIDDELYPGLDVWLSMNLLLPLASTVFFLLVMPWVVELVNRWNLLHQRRQKALELRSEGLYLLTQQQGADLKKSMVKRDALNGALREEVKKLKSSNSIYRCIYNVYSKSGGSDAEKDFIEYLMLHTFEVVTATQDVLHTYSLNQDGHLTIEWHGGRPDDEPEKWLLDGYCLSMQTGAGIIFQRAEFDPLNGYFQGVHNGRSVFFRALLK